MITRQHYGAAAARTRRRLALYLLGVLILQCLPSYLMCACVHSTAYGRTSSNVRYDSAFVPGLGARSRPRARVTALGSEALRRRGPNTPAPVYDDQKAGLIDKVVYRFFRSKVVAEVGEDVADPGFRGLMELVRRLNSRSPDQARAVEAAHRILRALFPAWMPRAVRLFTQRLPGLSARLHARIAKLTTRWLMGPCEVIDVEVDGGAIAKGQGLKVERCRCLEEANCASVCVNTCKLPTEAFFLLDMGLPVTLTPNHDDFSCEFAFGRTPPPRDQDPSLQVDCFAQCPTAKKRFTGAPLCYQIDVTPKALADDTPPINEVPLITQYKY